VADITLTIDGSEVRAQEGDNVLDAARAADIYIPSLCYDEDLQAHGACRLCMVEVKGEDDLQAACTTEARDGMVVWTDTARVNRVRRVNCELLIADHPDDCLSCASNQRCELQDIAAYLGIDEERLPSTFTEREVDDSDPFFVHDPNLCVMCGRCVRACHEVRGVGAIQFVNRGAESEIGTFDDEPIRETVCESCAECIERCPTGALQAKGESVPPREEVDTICPYCGCACGVTLGVRGGDIVRVRGDEDHPITRGSLCVKGRFGLDFVNHEDRLTKPLIRRGGELQEASWDEALDLCAEKFGQIKKEYGSGALAGLSSAKCTNEENYLFQKFMRTACGTNNVDHCARLCHSSTVAGLAAAFGSGAMTNTIDGLRDADCIFVTGSNTTEAHPIIALRIKDAVMNQDADLVVADPRKIDLTRFADLHVQQRCGTDVALFNAMMHVILEEGLQDEEYIRDRTENVDALRECVADYTPERAEAITGVPADDIRRAARTYAAADRASIVYSMGITQHTTGTDNVLALANLAMLTGNVGRASTGVNPLRGQNNVQGACDLGALSNVYPGYQKVEDPESREKFEQAWGCELDPNEGLTVVEIMNAAAGGDVRGLYVMGENPMLSDPNVNHVGEALEEVDFLVVQDLFLSETAEYADVVLPAASFAEKEGTYTSTERRVQPLTKAIEPPGEARPDWEIICDLSRRMGYEMSYDSTAEILDEIAELTPIYGGITADRLGGGGLQWPCPDSEHPGTPFLHEGEFSRGLGRFHATPFREADELPDDDYPLLLTTGRLLQHWHTGTMSRRTEGLEELAPAAPVEISPQDAEQMGIEDGEQVTVSSRRGTVTARAEVTDKSPPGTVFMPFHFHEGAANRLTNDALDPQAKIPEYKVCAVKVEKQEAEARV